VRLTAAVVVMGVCLKVAAPSVAASAAEPHDAKQPYLDLQHLTEQLAEREAVLRELTRQERSVTRALGELDESIAQMDDEVAHLDAAAQRAASALLSAEVEAARLNGHLLRAEDRLRKRLQAAFRLGPSAEVEVLLGARDLSDLVWRRSVLKRVAGADVALIAEVKTQRAALLRERNAEARHRLELSSSRAAMELARIAAAKVRVSRAEMLKQLAIQKGAQQRRLLELQQARRNLQQLVEDLPGTLAQGKLGAFKGQLPWPTEGRLESPALHADEQTEGGPFHGGISIVAPFGQPVYAVADGWVVHAGWLRGFGQLLIVDHGDGSHSLNAHLSRMTAEIGTHVNAGDVIAHVGDSESVHGSLLYFELRARGRPVDPLKWLSH
jgi:septal ring factor EnvC (AmiA/AmiB activator)